MQTLNQRPPAQVDLKKAAQCDSLRKGEPSDVGVVEADPTLESDTITTVPALKTRTREVLVDEDMVYQYYVGKRGKEIRHGLYQRVTTGDKAGKVLESGHFWHNKPIGRWTTWYLTGQVQTESEYKNGLLNGKMTTYHPDGIIAEQQDLVNGKVNCRDGYAVGYYPNGKIHFEQQIRDGFIIKDNRFDTLGHPIKAQ